MDEGTRQRMAALAKGNERRSACARFKKDLKSMGRHDALIATMEMIERIAAQEPGSELYGSLTTERLVSAIPGYGEHRTRRIAARAKVNPKRTLRSLHPIALKRLSSELESIIKTLRQPTSVRALERLYG